MKRISRYLAALLFVILSFISCEKNCKICQQNSYDSSGTLLTSGTEEEYCDVSLAKIEITPSYTQSGVTYKWVCR